MRGAGFYAALMALGFIGPIWLVGHYTVAAERSPDEACAEWLDDRTTRELREAFGRPPSELVDAHARRIPGIFRRNHCEFTFVTPPKDSFDLPSVEVYVVSYTATGLLLVLTAWRIRRWVRRPSRLRLRPLREQRVSSASTSPPGSPP